MQQLHLQILGKNLTAKLTASGVALVGANLIPVVGVIVFGWELFPLIFLYWFENAIIGVLNMLKMAVNSSREPAKIPQKLFMIPFFAIHYGGFLMVHGFFVMKLFGQVDVEVPTLATVLAILDSHGLEFAVLALVLSHGFSFYANYLRGGEWKEKVLSELMVAPYKRILVLHVFIIFGGAVLLALKSPPLGILLLAVLKTGVDLMAHDREHSKEHAELKKRMKIATEPAQIAYEKQIDPHVKRFPGYRRDTDAEASFNRPYQIGCGAAAVFFVLGVVLFNALSESLGTVIVIASIVVGIGAIVIYNLRKSARCSECGLAMKMAVVDCPPSELFAWERLNAYLGPAGELYLRGTGDDKDEVKRLTQRCFACHRCKLFFVAMKRRDTVAATGTEEIEKLLASAKRLIGDGDPTDSGHEQ